MTLSVSEDREHRASLARLWNCTLFTGCERPEQHGLSSALWTWSAESTFQQANLFHLCGTWDLHFAGPFLHSLWVLLQRGWGRRAAHCWLPVLRSYHGHILGHRGQCAGNPVPSAAPPWCDWLTHRLRFTISWFCLLRFQAGNNPKGVQGMPSVCV